MKTNFSLDDKYTQQTGDVFMSGVHALVRLPMQQRMRDLQAKHNTAGFISGYRGSPLGSYDQALWHAQTHLDMHHIVFRPGVNEELAATALWGTQQLGFAPPNSNKYDGVFGIWYGKGPGVDRCSDVFKHANMAGTTPLGGVLAVAGDDHIAKSSTAAHQSDHIFKACGLPVFFPSNVQEILDYGLHAIALSRYAGVWAGMKTIQEVVESSAVVDIDPFKLQIALPSDFEMPPGGVHIRWPDLPLEQEARLFDFKWYAALAYIRSNKLNNTIISSNHDRLGIIASGKAYSDTLQALDNLGLNKEVCQKIGLRLHKVGVVWPLEPQSTRAFALGLQEILVVEEKRQIIEYQLKEELYNWRSDVRPNVLGKFNEPENDFSGGEWSIPNPSQNVLLRANADLSPSLIAKALAQRLMKLGIPQDVSDRIRAYLRQSEAQNNSLVSLQKQENDAPLVQREAWFCSGCPHNTSTRVPQGSRAMAGIGCHYMTIWMDRATIGFTQMGGEGVPWVGQQPFSHENHVFANLGDGTYFHSGILAVRQSIAANVNITYKLLYNDAVAMTGGQAVGERGHSHSLSVAQILQSLKAEGVNSLAVVTDDVQRYHNAKFLGDTRVYPREALDQVQQMFKNTAGVSVIVYDQTCATEKRRRRKRGTLEQAQTHVIINEGVCEGCGDCSVQSNCLSVEPVQTFLGTKRSINQSTCNQDISCVQGFCPSFVTIENGQLRKKKPSNTSLVQDFVNGSAHNSITNLLMQWGAPHLETPNIEPLSHHAYGILIAGIGGTGVITIGQLLGVAAHLQGVGVVTQDAAGLAQKGGATWSHVLLAQTPKDIKTTRVVANSAHLILGCDPIVSLHKETLERVHFDHTKWVLNTHTAPTSALIKQKDWHDPTHRCQQIIAQTTLPSHQKFIDAQRAATVFLGDSVYANPLLLGFAWQCGWVPLSYESLMKSFELNAVAVEKNKLAFALGRWACAQEDSFYASLQKFDSVASPNPNEAATQNIQWTGNLPKSIYSKMSQNQPVQDENALKEAQKLREEFLVLYQDQSYSQRFSQLLQSLKHQLDRAPQSLESVQTDNLHAFEYTQQALKATVIEHLFKLMAYKDEYEVARLHLENAFAQQLQTTFEGDYKIYYHLSPPFFDVFKSLQHRLFFQKKDSSNSKDSLDPTTPNMIPKKYRFGAWIQWFFRFLVTIKWLRKSPLDPFGHSKERRMEKKLVILYEGDIVQFVQYLAQQEFVQLAHLKQWQNFLNWPHSIKGYGHVKVANIEKALQWRERNQVEKIKH